MPEYLSFISDYSIERFHNWSDVLQATPWHSADPATGDPKMCLCLAPRHGNVQRFTANNYSRFQEKLLSYLAPCWSHSYPASLFVTIMVQIKETQTIIIYRRLKFKSFFFVEIYTIFSAVSSIIFFNIYHEIKIMTKLFTTRWARQKSATMMHYQ